MILIVISWLGNGSPTLVESEFDYVRSIMRLRSGNSVNPPQRGDTLPLKATIALRIQFNGLNGQMVSRTRQDDIQLLVLWLRDIMTSLRLPHPKSTNVIKPHDTTNVVEMFWHGDSQSVRTRVLLHLPP